MLTFKGATPKSDIEAEARNARYQLMGEWLTAAKLTALFVAHTMEDQAETFLLRLARGSGLDGLSAMRSIADYPLAGFDGLRVVRPLLELQQLTLFNKKVHDHTTTSDGPFSNLAQVWMSH